MTTESKKDVVAVQGLVRGLVAAGLGRSFCEDPGPRGQPPGSVSSFK